MKETGSFFRIASVNLGNTPGLLSFLFCTYLLLVAIPDVYGQDVKRGKIYPTAGITWRSTAMNFFNFNAVLPDDFSKQYSYERNVQGFSLNIGIQYQLSNSVFLEYYPNLRYDVTHSTYDSKYDRLVLVTSAGDSSFVNGHPIYEKSFLIDHNFNIIRKIGRKSFGFGMTIVNTGKTINYPLNHRSPNPIIKHQNIEFKTYNAFVTIPLKKIFSLEFKALYIPRDFPWNVSEKYIMYSMRVYYRFKSLN